jgi:hypothetical protein
MALPTLVARKVSAKAGTGLDLPQARPARGLLVAENGGDTMLPRIGVMRALYPGDTTQRRRKKAAKEISAYQM